MRGVEGTTIVVTGASSGIGRACALRLAAEGATPVLVGRDATRLEEVRRATGGRTVVGDLGDKGFVKAFVKELKKTKTRLQGLVLAAGAHALRPMMMEDADKLAELWRANVGTSLGLTAAVLKARLLDVGSSVVLFSSVATRVGGAGTVSYASTKGALEGAVRSLAVEVAQQGVRVNAIAAGVVETPMSEKYLAKLPPEHAAHLRERHPLGVGAPEDVAGPVAFLISEDARWITGTVLVVDGGLSST